MSSQSWKTLTIGEYLELQRGYDLTSQERVDGNIPIMGAAGQNGWHNVSKVKGPGIVIGRSGGSFGKIHFSEVDYWPHNTAMFVKNFKGNDEYFTYYYLKNLDFSSLNSGSAQPSLNRNYIYPINVRVPLPKEQKAIAKVLSDLDAKIELNNKINTELEAMAKLIYDYWFVQFDFPFPSTSSVNGTQVELVETKPYKSSGGKMVYNEELKREIPEGWVVDTLSTWIKKDKSGDWGKESEQGNYIQKVSCIRGADINGLNGKGVVKSPERFILEKNKHKLLEIGDIIVEISGGSPTQSTGRLGFITKETQERFQNPLICSNFCKAVTLKEKKSLFNFVYEWNRLYDVGVLFGWEGKTSGIKNLLFDSFVTKYKTQIPTGKLMDKFYNKVTPIHSQIQKNLQQNQQLASLRDWLLPMLMNGQVTSTGSATVKEAEEKLSDLNMAAEPKVDYSK